MSTRHGMGVDWFMYTFWWVGPAGVDLFFVISGFIVGLTASKAAIRGEASGTAAFKFAAKRFFRIFPVYWIVLATAFVVSGHVELTPPDMPHNDIWRLISLTTTDNDKVMLAWTLAYELFFYAVLTLIIWRFPRAVFQAIGFWILLSFALVGVAAAHGLALFKYVPMNPLVLEFGGGCVIAYLVANGVKAAGWRCLYSGIVLFAIACWIHSQIGNWEPWYRVPIFLLPCALIVYGTVAIEINDGSTAPLWLQKLGDTSYSLYIWHQLVLAVLLKIFDHYGLMAAIPAPFILVIWGVLALATGFISFYVIERPIQHWAAKQFSSPKPIQKIA